MADEAFALSPISARAALPSEEDYDAIREAFMETSRGRWFLGEYAKRNRNADTRMVLDAVARIEETLAAQKKPPPDPGVPEALAGIRAALAEARTVAAAALGDLALEENLAPVRKGARVIREIAWRLREIGADSRICDLIDSQVSSIEAACGKMAAIDPADLSDAFGLIEGRIAQFDDGDAATPAPQPAEEAVRFSPQAIEESPSSARAFEEEAAAEPIQTGSVAGKAEAAMGADAMPAEPIDETVEAAEVIAEPADTFDAQDEAVLDMVALEMAAPDSDEAYDPPEDESYESEAAKDLPAGKPIPLAERPEPVATQVQPASEPVATTPSLGSSLIANGIVQRPRAAKPDPLAPIRRMSQSEKIAFFS